jgi:hypothetical protein
VSGSAPRCSYHRNKTEAIIWTHIKDSARQARCFDFFTIQAMRCLVHHEWGPAHTSATSTRPAQQDDKGSDPLL